MELDYDTDADGRVIIPERQRVAPTIGLFRGKYEFLSNFYNAPFIIDDIMFTNAESAFQSMKCRGTSLQEEFGIGGKYEDPKAAKAAGGRHGVVSLPDNWEDIKVDCMHEVLFHKFAQNPDLAEKLLNTGNAMLVEGNTWGDTFWGNCNGHGSNMLGRLLMDLRYEIATKWLR